MSYDGEPIPPDANLWVNFGHVVIVVSCGAGMGVMTGVTALGVLWGLAVATFLALTD